LNVTETSVLFGFMSLS